MTHHNPYHIIANCQSKEEFFQNLELHDPQSCWKSYNKVISYANQKFKDKEGIAGQWEANFQGKVRDFVKIKELEQWKKMFNERKYNDR
jgi:hypothetical protein